MSIGTYSTNHNKGLWSLMILHNSLRSSNSIFLISQNSNKSSIMLSKLQIVIFIGNKRVFAKIVLLVLRDFIGIFLRFYFNNIYTYILHNVRWILKRYNDWGRNCKIRFFQIYFLREKSLILKFI